MLHVQDESGDAGPVLEAREGELVDRNRREPDQRDLERAMMETATPISVSPNKMKSTGMPTT